MEEHGHQSLECRNKHFICATVIGLEGSNLENGVAMRMVDSEDGDNEYWQIGRQRHHPANQIGPERILLETILDRVIFDETEHQDCLQTSTVCVRLWFVTL